MTYYRVDAPTCYSIFGKAETEKSDAAAKHSKISAEIDELGAACTGKSAKLASSLNAIYNRVLTATMTAAEQQITNAAAGGRSAVAAIQRADHEMADRIERDAHGVDEVLITDGKDI